MAAFNAPLAPTNENSGGSNAVQPKNILKFTPTQYIEFDVVPDEQSFQSIFLENVTSSDVSYKVKTTNLQGYAVKPSAGIILPGEEKEITIHLNPVSVKTLSSLKTQSVSPHSTTLLSKDRFLIESQENSGLDDLKSPCEKESKDLYVFKHKLYVLFNVPYHVNLDGDKQYKISSGNFSNSPQVKESSSPYNTVQHFSPVKADQKSDAGYVFNGPDHDRKFLEIKAEFDEMKGRQETMDSRLNILQKETSQFQEILKNHTEQNGFMRYVFSYRFLILFLLAVFALKIISNF